MAAVAPLPPEYVEAVWACVGLALVFLALPAILLALASFRRARRSLRERAYKQRLGELLEGAPPAEVAGGWPWLWVVLAFVCAIAGFAVIACCGLMLLGGA